MIQKTHSSLSQKYTRLEEISSFIPVPPQKAGISWGVGVELPSEYKKWISRISSIDSLREEIELETAVLVNNIKGSHHFMEIVWNGRGAKFDIGSDAGVFIHGADTNLTRYTSDNLDSIETAQLGWTALTVYMKHITQALGWCERNSDDAFKLPELRNMHTTRITIEGGRMPGILRFE